jgi:hypothetical protein
VDDGYIGFTGSAAPFVFSSANTCFNTTGCNGVIDFYGLPSDIKTMFKTLFYIQPGNTTGFFAIRIRKQVPDGANPQNKFVLSLTDILFGADIKYATANEYEYEDYITPAPTMCPDVCVTSGADAEVNTRNTILIGVLGGICVVLLIVIAILIACANCGKEKAKKVNPP